MYDKLKIKTNLIVLVVALISVNFAFASVNSTNVDYRQIDSENKFREEIINSKLLSVQNGSMDEVANTSYSQVVENKNIDAYSKLIWDGMQEENKNNKYWKDVMPENITDLLSNGADQTQDKYSNKYIYIFISSSMPMNVLKNYVAVANGNNNIVFVLNGLIDNDIQKIQPTIAWTKSLMCRNVSEENCDSVTVDINPTLFERFKVSEVPSIVYVPNPNSLNECNDELIISEYLSYVGDTDILYVMDRFVQARKDDLNLVKIRESLYSSFFK